MIFVGRTIKKHHITNGHRATRATIAPSNTVKRIISSMNARLCVHTCYAAGNRDVAARTVKATTDARSTNTTRGCDNTALYLNVATGVVG